MAKAKYQQYFDQMMKENQELFDQFRPIHERYKQNNEAHQAEFNQQGKQVRRVIQQWDRKLCSVMGRSSYDVYSQQVSEKFWDLVRQEFDQIDMIGVTISYQ
ncbi:MAG: hypothetical protein GF381_02680 [Candidatus Pacebacteria bacterium]|nr:hypothetical protein [Candidatus Paceibacterota bacterium]